jgi:hypothetical protein
MAGLLLGIVVVAAVSAIGDYVWFEFGVPHRALIGILHGAVMLTAVGGALGAGAGRLLGGLPMGAACGAAGAIVYYALVPLTGGASMIVAWAVVWVVLAVGEGRLLRQPQRSWTEVGVRGLIAAAASGLTFSAVLGSVWGPAPAGGRAYLWHFAAWALAWGPGLLAISLGGTKAPPGQPGTGH